MASADWFSSGGVRVFPTAKVALQELENDRIFERVALHVLRVRFPDLRITTSSGDLGRDAFGRPLFGEDDKVVLWVSLQKVWTSKLESELVKNRRHDRKAEAFFVTNRSTKEATKERWRAKARHDYDVALEIVDLGELVTELEVDALRWVAEVELGVTPRAPRRLKTAAEYVDRLALSIPGMTAPLVGRSEEKKTLSSALEAGDPAARIVIVEGAGGAGKTRLAIEAARSTAAVLVAPTGVSLTVDAFTEAPVDGSLIVVVDDADRAHDLSGIPAVLHDSRFDRVRFVLTMRPGRSPGVLQRWGVEYWSGPVVGIHGLDRAAVDEIVAGHGIGHRAFRRNVIDLAQGNPLIAHTACIVGLVANRFAWTDAADLLRDTVLRRMPTKDGSQAHRAAAVALALVGTAQDGEDLAMLAGAITYLPPGPHELSSLLDDLSDAGLADSSPYSVRPAVAGPVLLADALDPQARVRLDAGRALSALMQRAGIDGSSEATHRLGEVNFRLGPQLNSLAVAARDRNDQVVAGRLHAMVRSLLPVAADVSTWTSVVGLAAEVVPASPGLLADLGEQLVAQWPPASSPRLWDDDAVAHYRHGLQGLAQRFAALAGRVELDTTPSPVSVLLDVAWLLEPALPAADEERRNGVLNALNAWCTTPPPMGNIRVVDELLDRRGEVLRSIAQWQKDRTSSLPRGLRDEEATKRGKDVLARVLVTAVRPLLRVTVESSSRPPEAADSLSLHSWVLPDRPETAALLQQAVALLALLLDEPELRAEGGQPVLHTLVGLPRELRAEGARPLLYANTAMPAHAVTLLDAAADQFSVEIAARWASLPVQVKRSAADAVIGFAPRPATLRDAADADDPVAAAAIADPELTRLMVLQPLSSAAQWREAQEDHRRAAEQLAAEVNVHEALELLDQTGPHARGAASTVLHVFAYAVGAAAADPQPVLDRIARAPLAGEASSLAGLAQAHPDAVWDWIEARVEDSRLVAAALGFADSHPAREAGLHQKIAESIAAVPTPDSQGAIELTLQLAMHLVACGQPLPARLKTLASLLSRGPSPALPRTLEMTGFVLDAASKDSVDIDDTLATAFTDALQRRCDEAHSSGKLEFDEDTAYGAAAIAAVVPASFATMLVSRLVSPQGPFRMPSAWKRSLRRQSPAARQQVTAAFCEAMESARATTPLGEQVELAAAYVLTALGEGTAAWADLIRRWAGGSPEERQRAVAAIQESWRDPLWPEIVSTVLAASIDANSRSELMMSVVWGLGDDDYSNDVQPRRAVLDPLLSDSSLAVRSFAIDALHRIDTEEEADRKREEDFRRGYRT